jgi:glycosyltransferase involved in cell wall biosynthesis
VGLVKLHVTIPVLNEAGILETSIGTLSRFLSDRFPSADWQIAVADNGSDDGTDVIAARLAAAMPRVRHVRIEERGRGRALKRAWLSSDADVCAYMDADLSTGLEAFPELVDLVGSGRCDVAYGSRLDPRSRTTRGWTREVLSRGYNVILRAATGLPVLDAQCGFKAVSRRVVRDVVPHIENDEWFFDTELLVLAERRGYRTAAVPITWKERTPSHVQVARTVLEDLSGLWRLRRAGR